MKDVAERTRALPVAERPSVDDVLEWMCAEEERPTNRMARRWMYAFPYYRKEIAGFVASWVCLDLLPAEQAIRAVEENEIVLMHMSKVDELLRESGH